MVAARRQLKREERHRRPPRNSLPLRPTEAMARAAEIEAAEAAHALACADPASGRLDVLRSKAEQARARAHRLRQALEHQP